MRNARIERCNVGTLISRESILRFNMSLFFNDDGVSIKLNKVPTIRLKISIQLLGQIESQSPKTSLLDKSNISLFLSLIFPHPMLIHGFIDYTDVSIQPTLCAKISIDPLN